MFSNSATKCSALIEVQETEKQYLCHEFHDGLIQYAVGSLMALESLHDGLSAGHSRSRLHLPESCWRPLAGASMLRA